MYAEINATMIHHSVLLEDIPYIKTVDCSALSVSMTFDTVADLTDTATSWGTAPFILCTNHLGDCNADNERRLYIVGSVTSDTSTLTLTASSTKTTFDNATTEMALGWTKQWQ